MFIFLRNIFVVIALLAGGVAPVMAQTLQSPSFVPSSRLASGHWVKIAVDTAGIYRIDYATLTEWGFSEPSKVGVYGTPAPALLSHSFIEEIPDDLMPVSTYHRDGALYFYGEADVEMRVDDIMSISFVRNHYDLRSYFFLHEEEEPRAPEVNDFTENENATTITNGVYVSYIENEVQNPVYGGIFYHDRRLSAGETQTFPFAIRDFDGAAADSAKVTFSFACHRPAPEEALPPLLGNDGTSISFSGLKNYRRPTYTGSGACYSLGASRADFTIPGTEADVKVTLTVPAGFGGDYYAIDRVTVAYLRTLRMTDRAETFYLPSNRTSTMLNIADATPDDEVWEIYGAGRVVRNELTEIEGGARVSLSPSFNTTSGRVPLVLFRPGRECPQPIYMGQVANQNLHADNTPDYLIITTEALKGAAEQLAESHRRLQHIDVAVVTQDDIFNEFSSGARMPQAFRRYSKMLYERGNGKLRWILLYGPSTFDNRGINADNSTFLVSFQSETENESLSESTNYVSDQYFGMLESGYNHNEIYFQPMSVAVGRLPVRSLAQAMEVNAKIERVLAHPMDAVYARRALFCSDRGDSYAHYAHCCEAIDATGDYFHVIDHVALEAYPLENGNSTPAGERFLRQINAGVGYVSYNGHGSPVVLTLTNMFKATHVDVMANTSYPLATFASCKVFDFDAGSIGLGEQMLLKPDGGFIGLVGAARSVLLTPNRLVTINMAREYAVAPAGATLGEVFKNARNFLIGQRFGETTTSLARSPAINFMCYNYGGDPAIPMPQSSGAVTLTAPMGAEGALPVLSSGTSTHIEFDVTGEDGTPVSADGIANVAVYATPRTLTFVNDKKETKTVEVAGDFLARYTVEVSGGRGEADVVIPEDVALSESNLLAISFTGDDGFMADGAIEVALDETTDTPTDVVAPVVEEIWAEGVDDKDSAPASFTLKARVRPGSAGVALGIGNPGLSPECMVDGTNSRSVSIASETDRNAVVLSVPLQNLADGRHQARLRVADYLGNKIDETFAFTVASRPLTATISLGAELADNEPVRDEATFDVAVDTDQDVQTTVVILDRAGNTVRRIADAGTSCRWDLADADGNRVPDGEYSAYALVRRGGSFGNTEPVRFIVLAPVGQ